MGAYIFNIPKMGGHWCGELDEIGAEAWMTFCVGLSKTSTVCLRSTNKLCLGQRLKYVNPLKMT